MVVLERITSSGVARGGKGGQLPTGATRRRAPKSINIVASEEGGGAPKSYKGNGASPPSVIKIVK